MNSEKVNKLFRFGTNLSKCVDFSGISNKIYCISKIWSKI